MRERMFFRYEGKSICQKIAVFFTLFFSHRRKCSSLYLILCAMRSSLVNRFNFLERKQKLRGAKCVLLITLLKFLTDTPVLLQLRKLSAGDRCPMIYYSGSPVEKSSNLIMLLRYTKKKRKKKKTFEESGSYFLFNDVHQQALAQFASRACRVIVTDDYYFRKRPGPLFTRFLQEFLCPSLGF